MTNRKKDLKLKISAGFTLVETLVGAFLFLIVSLSIYSGFVAAARLVSLSKIKTEASLLATEQFELIHNLPYQSVGISNGVPVGVLPRNQTFIRGGVTFYSKTTIRNIDDAFDGQIGQVPNDTSPADYKQVALTIDCGDCLLREPMVFTTTIAPKNLESSSNNGALFITVLDAAGQPVPQAAVHVVNTLTNPDIIIDEETTVAGKLQLVDVPPGVNAYQVTVTKSGYSTDQTYPITIDNPNPTLPHLTVATGQVTAKTFTIDRVGDLDISTITNVCAAASGVPFTLTGKLIGTDPSVYKYNQSFTTDAGGGKSVTDLEWDNYDLTLTGSNVVAGSVPFLPISLLPGATQEVSVVVSPDQSGRELLVMVKDAISGLPVSDAVVSLKKGSNPAVTLTTDRGSWIQINWSDGSGQTNWVDPDKYASDDGNVNYSCSPGDLKLRRSSCNNGNYVAAGELISSIFDSGSDTTTYYNLVPTWSGHSSTMVKFQLAATSTANATVWDYVGPDGTAATYYTSTNGNIHSSLNGKRYLRYRAFLSSTNNSRTPTLSDVSVTYGNGCLPFGQVFFTGLASGTYKLTVTKTGYQTYTNSNVSIGSNWQKLAVSLQPN